VVMWYIQVAPLGRRNLSYHHLVPLNNPYATLAGLKNIVRYSGVFVLSVYLFIYLFLSGGRRSISVSVFPNKGVSFQRNSSAASGK